VIFTSQRPLPSGRSSQIPAAARMLGINPSTCVQVALVKIPRAGCRRGARHRTPTAIGIGGINPSAPVQVAPVIILSARLGVSRAYAPRRRHHSYRQRGQEPEDPNAHDVPPSAPLLVTAQITLVVASFYYQSVAMPALLWFKKIIRCRFVGRQPSCSEHDVQNETRALGVG
jgi:hypothetical protein